MARFSLAFAIFAVHAVVTTPWAVGNWGASWLGMLLLLVWLGLSSVAIPIARGRIDGTLYWAALVAALILPRLAAYALTEGASVRGDPGFYHDLAHSLVAGNGLILRDASTQIDFRALYPPVYPIFLAGLVMTLGWNGCAIWTTNVALDLGSLVVLVAIGARLGSASGGRAAAWIFALWPAFIFAAPIAQKESLVTLLVLLIALILLRAEAARQANWLVASAIGLASGLLMLTQPGLAPLPAILALLLVRRIGWSALVRFALKAAPAALLVLAPWWIRNAYIFGTFVPLTTTGGIGLWIGNNPDATGNWMPLPSEFWGKPELEVSALAARAAGEWIVQNPLDFIWVSFFKLFHAFGVEQFTLGRFGLMTPQPGPATVAAVFPLLQGSLIALFGSVAVLGKQPCSIERRGLLALILIGLAIQILVFAVPFEFGERHRFFLMPFLFLVLGLAFSARASARAIGNFPLR